MSTRIRNATAEDHLQLLALARELATSSAVEAAAFDAAFDAVLVDPSSLVLVAEDQSDIVGYVLAQVHHTFHANGPVVWVEEILVDRRYRQVGIGSALMSRIHEWGESRGAAYIALATRRAAGFYEALGFEPSATYFKWPISDGPS